MEIITVSFFTVPEESGKKNSAVTIETWENIDTKDLQALFNYPNKLEAEREKYSSFPAFSILGLNTLVLDLFSFSTNCEKDIAMLSKGNSMGFSWRLPLSSISRTARKIEWVCLNTSPLLK